MSETPEQNETTGGGCNVRSSDLLGGINWPVGGYAPGHYSFRCGCCGGMFYDGDKRASQCLPCAVEGLKRQVADHRNQNERLADALNPRRWTAEMSKAWHAALPDTHKAFDDLRNAAVTPNA